MAGFLRFLAFFVLLLAGFVLVVLPFLLSPLLTQLVRDAGLRSATLDVTVAPLDPTLVLGRARQVTLVATEVDMPPAHIGRVDVAVGEASYFDRTFQTVRGEMTDVSLAISGDTVDVATISIAGPSDAAAATAVLNPSQTERLIRLAAGRVGIEITSVLVGETGITVTVSGLEAKARVLVQGGALLLDPGVGVAVVLLQPAPSDPWSLSEAWITRDGLNVRGTVDVSRIARGFTGFG